MVVQAYSMLAKGVHPQSALYTLEKSVNTAGIKRSSKRADMHQPILYTLEKYAVTDMP